MERNGAIDVAEKVKGWQGQGWSRFDQAAAPYPADELARERQGLAAAPRARGTRCVFVYRAERRRIA